MKMKDLKISWQLNMGLAIIFLLVILLGSITLRNTNKMWQITVDLHDHPLTVQQAISRIQADALNMRLEMKELVMESDAGKIQARLKGISTYEADAFQQFEILYASYLGPRQDVENAYNAMVEWKPVRDEVIRLWRAGERAEALTQTRFDGASGMQGIRVEDYLAVISSFAENKSNQFYSAAQASHSQSARQTMIILGAILLLAGGVILLLRQGILAPLQELTVTTEAFRQGELASRSGYESGNEFGSLVHAFNTMADTVQTEMQNKDKLTQISAAMFQADNLPQFCQSFLAVMMENTGSQVGAVYLLDEQKRYFQHFSSIGLKQVNYTAFAADSLEGEFGAALAGGRVQHLQEIPAETPVIFSTVCGDLQAKEIITIPVQNGGEVVAVVSLASLKSYSPSALWLVQSLFNEVSARFNSILAGRKIEKYAQNLHQANAELQQQAKELSMQTDELVEQNMELEMQSRELSEASRLKSSFLSNMSHELRTPLNSVIALASVLNRRLKGAIPDEEYSYLRVIERNGKNLLSLVNDILDLSRIEAGKEEVNLGQVNLKTLVEEAVEMLEAQAEKKGIRIISRLGDDLPEIISDGGKCRHILQNILGNAVKFTDQGEVMVYSRLEKNRLQILVRDSGSGISPEHLEFIFDEFRQVDETAARKNGGTGLGLAIAQKYANLLGGSITVASQLGQGSTFIVNLPREQDSAPAGQTATGWGSFDDQQASRPGLVDPLGKCVLLVEDSEPAIIQTVDILSHQGYQVLVARSGREALEKIEKTRPDGMILDLMMPEMDGFQVLKSIRSHDRHASIPVLILTAKHITRDELSFLKTNHVYQLIQKGDIDKKELLDAVANMVTSSDQPAAAPVKKQLQSGGKPLVLVVEDNPDNLITVKALLQESYTIAEATDGRRGVAQAMHLRPDLILMDISLPEMDGFQAFTAIRNCRGLQHIPIIALTARAMAGDRERILAYGFDGYVAKPLEKIELEKVIGRHFDA